MEYQNHENGKSLCGYAKLGLAALALWATMTLTSGCCIAKAPGLQWTRAFMSQEDRQKNDLKEYNLEHGLSDILILGGAGYGISEASKSKSHDDDETSASAPARGGGGP